MRTLLAATGIAVAAIVVGVGAYAVQTSPTSAPTGASAVAVDDRDVQGGTSTTSASSSSSPSTPPAATVDDNGGLTDRDDRVEPGDDRDGDSSADGDEDGADDGKDHADDAWEDSGHLDD